MMPTLWPFSLGFVVCALIVPALINWQRRKQIGQQVYEDGPKGHAVKQGTPTMGGVAFLAAAALGLLFSRDASDARLLLLVGGAGLIGTADDLLILMRRRALGLRARWKFALLAAVALAYLALAQSGAEPLGYAENWFGTQIALPPWLWWLLSLAAIVGAANAVNLTDGLDGLAVGTVLVPLLALSFASLSAVSVCVLGACVAFLWFNWHPAKIFMGDAGSLLLGALLAGDAIERGWLLVLPLLGMVFVVEALSVILQVASFKLTRRRVFKMSPLHHHFELSGWSEGRVTIAFIAASVLATCATVYGMLKGVGPSA